MKNVHVPTLRPLRPVPDFPIQVLPSIELFELVLPTHSDSADKTLGVLRYDAGNVAGSEADIVYPIGNFTYRYFFVERHIDGVDEVVMRPPISGSPTTADPEHPTINDHTRVEMRQRTPGPSGHRTPPTTGKGDFQLSEKLRMWGLCRPTRFPDRTNTGDETANNNLTLMQLQPTDGTSGATTTFVILALRKNGNLEATQVIAGASSGSLDAVPGNKILLSGVQLGDIIWWRITTSATSLLWEAENRTRGGGIQTLTQPIPDITYMGVNQRTRYHAYKIGCYHGTNVIRSTDDMAGKRVGGIVAHSDVTDFAESRWRGHGVDFLP